MPEHRFDEEQVVEVLRRATEIQMDDSPRAGPAGLSMQDLQRLAGEIGIEPAAVEKAAKEALQQSSATHVVKNTGSVMLEKTAPGVLNDEQWEDLLFRIRNHTGYMGTSTVDGDKREWRAGGEYGSMFLTTVSRRGSTRIQMLHDKAGGMVVFGAVGCMFSLMASLVLGKQLGVHGLNPNMANAIGVALFMILVSIIYFRMRSSMKRAGQRVEELMDLIAETIRTGSTG
jgi:hypothetical protein